MLGRQSGVKNIDNGFYIFFINSSTRSEAEQRFIEYFLIRIIIHWTRYLETEPEGGAGAAVKRDELSRSTDLLLRSSKAGRKWRQPGGVEVSSHKKCRD